MDVLSRQLAPHRLLLREPGQVIRARIASLQLGAAYLVNVGYGADVDVHASEFTEQYLVHAAIEGGTEICTGNRTILMWPISVWLQPKTVLPSTIRPTPTPVPTVT